MCDNNSAYNNVINVLTPFTEVYTANNIKVSLLVDVVYGGPISANLARPANSFLPLSLYPINRREFLPG